MPPAVPDRYRLEMRLGRDEDVEEWLATDTSLDRPVLIRSLGPESSQRRRADFVAAVSAAASVDHQHLTKVYAVEEVEGGAYAVVEWTGGTSAADWVRAAGPIDLEDFLPNAAGLAGALAALHDRGAVHGSIDLAAVSYSVAHPAKLGALGRVAKTGSDGDVRSLAASLETILTGSPPGGPPPSERIDGVPRAVDRILRSAQSGGLDASRLEEALRAAPTARVPAPQPKAGSRRLLVAAAVLVVLAIGLVSLGLVFSGGPTEPVLPTSPPLTTTTSMPPTTTTTAVAGQVTVTGVSVLDPFGEGGEHDQEAPNVLDGDQSTAWQTEGYADPLRLIKPGVGLVFSLVGTPGRIEIGGLGDGTRFEIYWSPTAFSDPAEWSRIAGAQASPGLVVIDLPERDGGHWLLWLVELPLTGDGSFRGQVSEVRFLP